MTTRPLPLTNCPNCDHPTRTADLHAIPSASGRPRTVCRNCEQHPALTYLRARARRRDGYRATVALAIAPAIIGLARRGAALPDIAVAMTGSPRSLAALLTTYADLPGTPAGPADIAPLIACPHAHTYLDPCPGCAADRL